MFQTPMPADLQTYGPGNLAQTGIWKSRGGFNGVTQVFIPAHAVGVAPRHSTTVYDSGSSRSLRSYMDIVTDNCATYHLFGDIELFTIYHIMDEEHFATASDGQRMHILGYGAVGGLHHVFHVEGIIKNLISLAYLSNVLGYYYTGGPGVCSLLGRDGSHIWHAYVSDESLLPVLNPRHLLSLHLSNPDGSEMESTRETMLIHPHV